MGLAAILFMIGYILFGIAMIRTATMPRWSGVLVAVGAPAHLLGFGMAQLVSTAAWPIAILGSVSLGAGLAWAGYRLWHTPAASDVLVQKGRREYEQRIFRESRREPARHCSPRTGDHLSGGCHAAGLFFVVPVVLMASAPSVLWQPDQEVRAGGRPTLEMWCSKTVVNAERRIRIVGDLAGELIHLGQSVMHAGDTIDGSSTRRWPCRLALMCISTWRTAGYSG
jgi:hypothetical protein